MKSNTSQSKNPDPFCNELSRGAGEAMIGTAPVVETWFLLEYNGPWNRNATEDNDLPLAVQAWFRTQLGIFPNSRLQFIKQQLKDGAGGLTFFVALCREVKPRLYRFSLDDYDALLKLDLLSVIAGNPAVDSFLQAEPLYLVCTNGKRDRCCAREGPALYQAMANIAGEEVWQCTHLGGHRFAPTVVTLPDGAFYGRLESSEVIDLVGATTSGDLVLKRLRGRCIYDPVCQAAEWFLRQRTGVHQRNAYVLKNKQSLDNNRWLITFREIGGSGHHITLQQKAAVERLVSCNPSKTKAVSPFHLEAYRRPVAEGPSA